MGILVFKALTDSIFVYYSVTAERQNTINMKKITQHLVALACIASCGLFAQNGSAGPDSGDLAYAGSIEENNGDILYYRVEEKTNMKFGGHVRTYKVSHLSLVSKTNLGPGNTRTVTPVYANKPKEEK
jgi:hypothetical protein